jgi:tetratricopeptide (TPR) repeat protein
VFAKSQAEAAMMNQIQRTLIVGLTVLGAASSAQAFQGGGRIPGGMGFTGSPGGGFTGPRGGGFTETLGGTGGLNNGSGNGGFLLGIRRARLTPQLPGNPIRLNPAGPRGNPNVSRTALGYNNPYLRIHEGWINGYWNGQYAGGLGWRRVGYGDPGFSAARLGSEAGFGPGTSPITEGLSSWMYGPMLYNFGYWPYSNPYVRPGDSHNAPLVAGQLAIDDYTHPLSAQGAPPDQAAAAQAMSSFVTARQAFKSGDYRRALEWVHSALQSTPDDPILHEFRALTLFALKRYDEAAPALYAVLSVEPGWDWTTLIGLYGNPATYAQQIQALETFKAQNPQAAPARFVLAYLYLTEEHAGAALEQLMLARALSPSDALSTHLIEQLEHPRQPATRAGLAPRAGPADGPPSALDLADSVPTGKNRRIEGIWRAQPANDINISAVFHDGDRFSWKVSQQGKDRQFQGRFTSEYGVLALVEYVNTNTLVGRLHWTDETHFVFKVMGRAPADPGLSFAKTPWP